MAESDISICNQALGKIGAKRINNLETDTSLEAQQCRLHFEPTRDALLRTHSWRFARARAILSQDTNSPVFEWDNQFILPSDFLRFRSVFEEESVFSRNDRHAIEGDRYLTNFDAVNLRYIKRVTDASKFDPLFTKLFTWFLADEMVGPLAGGDVRIQKKIDTMLLRLTAKAEAANLDETDVGGRSDWNLARFGGLGITNTPERFL